MRKLRLIPVAIVGLLLLASGDAVALRDPFIVCVTDPCGPPWWP